jgi:CheY-like chemotaxis protein
MGMLLLADDNKDHQLALKSILKQFLFNITVVENSQEALELFQKQDFDIVLMDLNIPVMGGLEATAQIRKWEVHSKKLRTPVIMISTQSDPEIRSQSLSWGCDAFLTKPVQKNEIVSILSQFLTIKPYSTMTEELDPEIMDLVPSYIESRHIEMEEISMALQKSDFHVIRILGHNMKGVASSYGFEALSQLGALLEESAVLKDRESTVLIFQKIKTYLASLNIKAGET